MWQLEIVLRRDMLPYFEAVFEDMGLAFSTFETAPDADPLRPAEHWLMQILLAEPPDRAALTRAAGAAAKAAGIPTPALRFREVPQEDWVLRTNRLLAPVRAGRFHIYGAAHAGTAPAGSWPLQIEAGAASGTGRYPPTLGCLLAIDGLARRMRVRHALDIGCGSGILGLAAARAWHCPVLAVDIDRISVAVTSENAGINRLGESVRARLADGLRDPRIERPGGYDLVLANLLQRPLLRLAPRLPRLLSRRGVAVLSGLLGTQEASVVAACRRAGLRLIRRIELQEWRILELDRGGPGAC